MMTYMKLLFIALFLNPSKKDTRQLDTHKRLQHLIKLVMLHRDLVSAYQSLYRISYKLPVYLIEPMAEKVISKMKAEAKHFGEKDAQIGLAKGENAWREHSQYLIHHPVLKTAYLKGIEKAALSAS